MLTSDQVSFLQSLSLDYAQAILGGMGSLGELYDTLTQLQEGQLHWLDAIDVLQRGADVGDDLVFLNRLVDFHRYNFAEVGGASPLIGYGLGVVLGESLIICRLADHPESAVQLPVVAVDRLDELYSEDIQQWIQGFGLIQQAALPPAQPQYHAPQNTQPPQEGQQPPPAPYPSPYPQSDPSPYPPPPLEPPPAQGPPPMPPRPPGY